MTKLLIIFSALTVAACGMKGSLELPPGPPPAPVLDRLKSKPPAKPAPQDATTDKKDPAQ